MKLPNATSATVPRAKVERYLLSPTHSTGRHKAAFFARFGFELVAGQVLRDALLRHGQAHDVETVAQTSLGLQYTVVGPIETPDGRNPVVRTVWFIDEGEDTPRFVTAYPMGRRQR